MRKLIESKLSIRHFINGINTWSVLLVRCSGPFLKRQKKAFNKLTREQEN